MPRLSKFKRLELLVDRVDNAISELEGIRSALWDLVPRKKLRGSPNAYVKIIQDSFKRLSKTERKFRKQAQLDFDFVDKATWPPVKVGETLRIRLPNDYQIKRNDQP